MMARHAGDTEASAYARLLEAGVGDFRFPEPVETEFHRLQLGRCRTRVRFWQVFILIMGLVYGVGRLYAGMLGAPATLFESVLRFGVAAPAWAVLAAIAWSPAYGRLYWPVARVLVPLTGCVFALLMTLALMAGRGQALSGLAAHMLALMFLSGLLFRQALWVCGLMMCTFIAAAAYAGVGLTALFFDSVSPLMTVGIGAFVYYEIEKSSRRAFLEQRHAAELAASDGLTGLKNRRAFDEHLTRIWQHAIREGRPLGLLLIDADEFKGYNDHYGHQAGDRCLKRIARVAQRFALRPLDIAARFGGEEFAVVLYDMDAEQVRRMADGIRVAVLQRGIEHANSRTASAVTVSVGAACIQPVDERRPENLVRLADQALYMAKRSGRNRVELLDGQDELLATEGFHHPMLTD